MNDFSGTAVVLLVILPLAGSVLSLVEKSLPRFRVSRVSAPLCLLGCAGLLVYLGPFVMGGGAVVYELGGWPEPLGIALHLDGFAWLGSVVILMVTLPALLYAAAENTYSPAFYFFFLVITGAMAGLVLTGDLFNMFVFFEILSLGSCVLVAYTGKPRAVYAAFKYLLVGTLGIVFFLAGVLILYRLTGTLSLRDMGDVLPGFAGSPEGFRVRIAVLCLAAGIGVRAAVMPFHLWLPDAHASAPHPVSAMLSGAMIKVSFLALWRIVALFGAGYAADLLVVVGAFTALFGVVRALSQTDVKRLLAYHSVSQMGYIVAAFGAGTALARTASFLHILNHALFKSLLFLSVGVAVDAAGQRNIKLMKGAGRRFPWAAIPFAAAALSIAGVPPWNGFVSKSLISQALKGHWTYPLIYLTGIGTVASFIKLSAVFRGGPADRPAPVAPGYAPSRGIYPSLWFLASACLLLGAAPGALLPFFAGILGADAAAAGFPDVYAASSLLASVPVIAAGILLYVFVVSKRGERASAGLRSLSFGMEGELALVPAGFVLFFVVTAAGLL